MKPFTDLARGFTFITFVLTLLLCIADAQTCSSTSPCKVGCCANTGNCGFGPAFCGAGNCTSSCDAKAECGQYAPAGKTNCPLNVCCSQYGFCGTTSDFCGTGCQNGCAAVNRPSGGGSSSSKRRIGYYSSWNINRACDVWQPENINANLWTHINYAFALIDGSGRIGAMNSFDTQLYPRVTGLKKQNPALKVYISVGGWDAGGTVFSNMVATAGSRSTFINSAISFMNSYGFDGIDIDWEYPYAADRGGVPADTANYLQFIKELKAACGSRYGVTLTLPSSYWYLQGFDIVGMQPYVDWYNLMSYDIHGTWDGNNPYTTKTVAPHTNLTEISQALDLLWRNNISPSKVVLGLGYYGRSFTLASSSCNTPGCAFSGGGNPGSCTATSGVLSNAEIQRIITQYSLTPKLDTTAGIKWITWNSDQWVSYDDQDTYKMKEDFANKLGLSGLMVWAIDLDDPNSNSASVNLALSGLRSIGDDVSKNADFALKKYTATNRQNQIQLGIFWTDCMANPVCPPGFKQMTDGLGHGKVFDADQGIFTADGCHGGGNGYNRALCIEENVQAYGCGWYGKAKDCRQTCPSGSMLVTQNTHIGHASSGCDHNRYSSYCCTDFSTDSISECPATNLGNSLSGGLAPRIADTKAVSKYNTFSYNGFGTKYECSAAAQMALDGAYIVGGTAIGAAGLYILTHMPGYWTQSYGIYVWKPIVNLLYPSVTTKLQCTTTTTTTIITSTVTGTVTSTCDGAQWPQACLHYSSVIRDRGNFNLAVLTCPIEDATGGRNVVSTWSRQHHTSWRMWVPQFTKLKQKGVPENCQIDEFPPYKFQPQGAWIRYLPGGQNGGAGNLWANVCGAKQRKTKDGPVQGGPIQYSTCTSEMTRTVSVNAFKLAFKNMPNLADDGIQDNPCLPIITNDAGFALLTDDAWYGAGPHINPKKSDYWSSSIPATLTAGVVGPPRPQGPYKRDLMYANLDPESIFVEEGNSTRRATDEELWEQLGFLRCEDEDCTKEQEALNIKKPDTKIRDIPITASGPIATDLPFTTTGIAPPAAMVGGSPLTEYSTPTETAQPETTANSPQELRMRDHLHRHAYVHGHGHHKF